MHSCRQDEPALGPGEKARGESRHGRGGGRDDETRRSRDAVETQSIKEVGFFFVGVGVVAAMALFCARSNKA